MGSSPENQGPIFLSPQDLKRKFEELEMLPHLHSTCILKKIENEPTDSCLPAKYRHRRISWKGENFIRKDDGESQAILYWRKTPDGGEEYRVEQFTAPDGTFYASDAVRFPITEL